MSSRATRVRPLAVVEPFDWGVMGEADAPVVPVDALPVVAPAPPDDTADEGQRVAEIERDAFAKGYAEGERCGAEAAATRTDAVLGRLAHTLEELGTLREQMICKTEREVVQLALAIAARILHREVAVDRELLVALARVALDRLGERSSATVRLNPEDCPAGAGRTVDQRLVRIVPDPAVVRGGCRVESDFGSIDVGVEAQLKEITDALLGDGIGATIDDLSQYAER